MTLQRAHELLEMEYHKNEIAILGSRRGKMPDSVRVAQALLIVADIAKAESTFFSLPKVGDTE